MHDVMTVGVLREWLAHWTTELWVLLAAAVMLFAPETSAYCPCLMRARRGAARDRRGAG